MPISGKELMKLFLLNGWEKDKNRRGATSHVKLKKDGYMPVIIPMHKELKKGLEKDLLKILTKSKNAD